MSSAGACLPWFIAAIVLALVFAGALQIWLPYTRGANHLYAYIMQGNNVWAFNDYQPYMTHSASNVVDFRCFASFGFGIAFTIFLSYMRSAFVWWPFHPLGYALCGSWTMVVLWFPCLVAWLIKTPILRYGGMRLFVKVRPFFIGLMIGECAMAVIWTLISATTGAPTPEFPWP